MEKYETIPDPSGLLRIKASRDIPRRGVKAGDLGGLVESAKNLSQDGDAWVFGDAWVSGDAKVLGNAKVFGNAGVSGNAEVLGRGHVLTATVYGSNPHRATLYRTSTAPTLHVGCWQGSISEFREMIESDQWVDATPEQIRLRRPEMLAFAQMCEARAATWTEPESRDATD